MDLVPSERAVLTLIRMLFLEGRSRTHRVTVLQSRWPVVHAQAYDGGYIGLLKKRLIEASADHQSFTITNAGLKLLATGIK